MSVAEELHFGRAADRLFITAPRLGRQIKVLERDLDTSLRSRGRCVEPIAVGVALLAVGRDVLRAAGPVARQRDMAARLPVGRTGRPGGIAAAIPALMHNPFVAAIVCTPMVGTAWSDGRSRQIQPVRRAGRSG